MKFAKLFNVNEVEDQVLVTRILDEQDKEAPYKLKLATDYKGIYLEAVLGYKDESHCDLSFEDFNAEKAMEFFKGAVEAIEETDKEFEG